jgi:phage protein U
MKSTLLLLGPFRFSVGSAAFDELSRASRWDWKQVDRVGEMPALQFTGPQNDTISMSGRLTPPLTGGIEQLARMRTIADAGLPLPIIDGTGRVHGMWVIESLEETGTKHFKDGYPKMTTFNLSLKKYGDGRGIIGGLTKLTKIVSLFG